MEKANPRNWGPGEGVRVGRGLESVAFQNEDKSVR